MSISGDKAELNEIDTFPFPVYASHGYETHAASIAVRCAKAYEFLSGLFPVSLKFDLKALNKADWESHASDYPFGMPHYKWFSQSLRVAVEPGDFWIGFVEIIRNSSSDAYHELQSVYGRYGDEVDVSQFFNLLVVHELGHAVHHQGKCEFPRQWIMEFFCNLCLHAYVVSIEPEELPLLETFPRLMTEVAPSDFPYQSLDDLKRSYSNMSPQNYGWYQTQLHVAAKRVYEAGGEKVLKKLWNTFHAPDSMVEERLRQYVHSSVAEIMTTWPITRAE
jgi:hypothetical protein